MILSYEDQLEKAINNYWHKFDAETCPETKEQFKKAALNLIAKLQENSIQVVSQ